MGNEYFYSGEMDSFDIFGSGGAGAAGILGAFVLVYGLVMLFAMAYSIAAYVLHSLGLYTIAQRRRIRKPWLAWIPLGNLWLLGSISDQYQYVAKGKVTGRRKIMLGLSIATAAIYFVWLFVTALSAVTGVGGVATVLLVLFGLLALFAVAITLAVFEYMCYYDLYRSCERTNGVLYLILSIIFSAIMPFLVFACRNKDDGMPRRKQPAAVIPAETVEPQGTKEETEGEPKDEQEIPVADA